MNDFEPSVAMLVLTAVQVLGLASAWMARVSERSHRAPRWQQIFFVFLALVGGSTIGAMAIGPGACCTSGATLAAMVLAAVCDFSTSARTTG